MKFGPVPVEAAEGAVLAHSVVLPGERLRKGRALDAADVLRLRQAGLPEVVVARMEPGDLGEDAAAARVAAAVAGAGLEVRPAFTGRANIHATASGIVEIDRARIDAVNAVSSDVTIATLPEWQRVASGTMVATVKIIPFAVPGEVVSTVCTAGRALALRAPVVGRADLIVTRLPGDAAPKLSPVIDRLTRLGVDAQVTEVAHASDRLAAALSGAATPLRLILTASATSDAADVGPAALRAAGGRLTRFGMPVDPGNLLFLGDLGDASVIGLPGCARSPALNGADWVLERVVCGVPVAGGDIAAMGVGGLLGEIPTRPQPRERG
ncbi:molybdopterin-binding protein [Jannaschia marina]|uniref:molybdopterin-binding protein n=1 Tax=Jannaschia marina TaxID=2741674 RepID=UPI0015CC827D|nr:molybdopterin-binding protein [Jannaschia marina]